MLGKMPTLLLRGKVLLQLIFDQDEKALDFEKM